MGAKKANKLIKKFEDSKSAKESALICVEEIISDLRESLEVAEGLHPHAEGLIAGSLSIWYKVKSELEAKS